MRGRGVAPALTEKQKAKWVLRLQTPEPDRSDVGQELPRTTAALDMPVGSPKEAALRTAALVEALEVERLVVEVPVESHPDSPDHAPIDLAGEAMPPLKFTDGPYGPAVMAFSSAQELAAWSPSARPMTMSAQRVAVIAGVADGSGSILVNPGSKRSAVVPRSAALALAAGGSWLPPWEDTDLRDELLSLTRAAYPNVVDIQLVPLAPLADAPWALEVKWDGMLGVKVLVNMVPSGNPMDAASDPEAVRGLIAAALRTITSNERLKESAPRVEVIPTPVYGL